MEICKAPTLRLKALNKHTHIMYIEMENVNFLYIIYICVCVYIYQQGFLNTMLEIINKKYLTKLLSPFMF